MLKVDKMDLRETQGYRKSGYEGAALRQGTSGIKLQTSTEEGNRAKYQTRVVSNANKVNLKFEEAKPALEAQLAKSVANIM